MCVLVLLGCHAIPALSLVGLILPSLPSTFSMGLV